ncbi:MAG: hypothetical protein WAT12_05680 [Candidatus Nitrotoga sp.]
MRVNDANDLTLLTHAYENFLDTHDRPTLIIVRSHIGLWSAAQAGPARSPRARRLAPKKCDWRIPMKSSKRGVSLCSSRIVRLASC